MRKLGGQPSEYICDCRLLYPNEIMKCLSSCTYSYFVLDIMTLCTCASGVN